MYKYSYSDSIKFRLDLYPVTVDFYTLLQITRCIETADIPLSQRETITKLYLDSYFLLKDLSDKLSKTIFDYMFLASVGEARHFNNSQFHVPNLKKIFGKKNDRLGVQKSSLAFNPFVSFRRLETLFKLPCWGNGYGGIKWAKICQAGLLYTKIPNITFIDHIINITHNGGTAFDKGILLFISDNHQFQAFLNTRKRSDMFLLGQYYEYTLKISSDVLNILKKLIEIGGILPYQEIPRKIEPLSEEELAFPKPIVWGNLFISEVYGSNGVKIQHIEKEEEEEEEVATTTPAEVFKQKVALLNNIKELRKKIEYTNNFEKSIKKELPIYIQTVYNEARNLLDTAEEIKEPCIEIGQTVFNSTNFNMIPDESIIRCVYHKTCSKLNCKFISVKPKIYITTFPSYCATINQEPFLEILDDELYCCNNANSKCYKALASCYFRTPKRLTEHTFLDTPFPCFYNSNKYMKLVPEKEVEKEESTKEEPSKEKPPKEKKVKTKTKVAITLKEDNR